MLSSAHQMQPAFINTPGATCFHRNTPGVWLHAADGSEADLTVYGNVFIRPRFNATNTTTSAASRRRRLQQSGTAAADTSPKFTH